jgi:hypothetical protein
VSCLCVAFVSSDPHEGLPRKQAEAVTLLACVQEVFCSSLGVHFDCPDGRFPWFSSLSPGKEWNSGPNEVTSETLYVLLNSLFIIFR